MTDFIITPEIRKKLLATYSPKVFKIQSETNPQQCYCVQLVSNHFTCTCPDATFRNLNSNGTRKKKIHYCKHCKAVAKTLLLEGLNASL